MVDAYAFTKDTASDLAKLSAERRTGARQGAFESTPTPGRLLGVAYIAKVGAEAITAISGSTPGTAEVSIYKLNDSGDLEDTGLTQDVYNLAGEVAAEAWIKIGRDSFGTWWVEVENCGS